MEPEIILRIVLEDSTPGVDYGLQEGKGVNFKTVQTKRGDGGSLEFECSVRVKPSAANTPVFLGPFAQGRQVTGLFILILELLPGKKIHVGAAV